MNTFLTIKKFVFAAFIAALFALPLAAQDWKTVIDKAFDAYKAKKYDESFEAATQAWNLARQSDQKYLAASVRALAVKDGFLNRGWTLTGSEYAFKYDPATSEKIRAGIADRLFVLDYLERDPAATAEQKKLKNYSAFDLGLFYVNLADRATHDRRDYANAEKYLRLAASMGVASGDPTYNLPRVLAAQWKFDDARREIVRQFAAGKDYYYVASKMIGDFDFVGEFYLGEAVLLTEAGRLKAAGKPLTDLGKALETHQTNLRNVAKITDPATVYELNRQGALLYLMKQPEKAAAVLERAAQTGENPTALRWLALVRLQQQNYPAAEALAAKILAANPSDAIGLTARGLVAATRNDFARAEKDLNQAISLFPEAALFANAYKILAFVYQKQNKIQPMNDTLAKQKTLEALYQEVKNSKPKSSIDGLLDYVPGKN